MMQTKDDGAAAVPPGPEPSASVVRWLGAALLAAVPLVSLGLLAPLPSAVLVARFRRRADLLAGLALTVTWVLWVVSLDEWNGHDGWPVAGTALLLVNTAGPVAHTVLGWPRRP